MPKWRVSYACSPAIEATELWPSSWLLGTEDFMPCSLILGLDHGIGRNEVLVQKESYLILQWYVFVFLKGKSFGVLGKYLVKRLSFRGYTFL